MTHAFISEGAKLLMILPVETSMNFYLLVCVPGEPLNLFLSLPCSPFAAAILFHLHTTKSFFSHSHRAMRSPKHLGDNCNLQFGRIILCFLMETYPL